MEKDTQIRMDWFEYERIQKALQRKHSVMLKNYSSKKTHSCKWVRYGEQIEMNGYLLTKGAFYVGEYFEIPNSYKTKEWTGYGHRNQRKFYGPVIQENLSIEDGIVKVIPFSSYLDMHPTHRNEYLLWLAEKKNISEISKSSLMFYIFGLQLRMFVDDETDDKERLDIIYHSFELYNQCIENGIEILELELFINAAIRCYFKGKELDILTKNPSINDIDGNVSVLYRICNNIVRGLKTKYAIPEELISDNFINKVREFVESDIKKLVNSVDTTTELGSFLSMYYTLTKISGSNMETLFCYDLDLNIRLREDYQLCYAISKCTKQFCKETYAKLKEFHLLNKISPDLSYFVLPPAFSVYDYKNAISYMEKLKEETDSQEYTLIPVNRVLGVSKNSLEMAGKIDKTQITAIIKCIGKMGYGIIPNMLVDEMRFNYGDNCILYREPNNEEFNIAILCQLESIIKIFANIVVESYDKSDMAFIDNFIKVELGDTSSQRYLMAYLRWILLTSLCKLTRKDKESIEKIAQGQNKRIVIAAACLATKKMHLIQNRMSKLREFLPLLNIAPQNIHTLIHRIATMDEEFATIEKTSNASGYSIKEDEASLNISTLLSEKRLAIVEKQTKVAQDLLSDIFEEDDEGTDSTVCMNNVVLDILAILLTKESWKRSEVETICQKHHLMIGSVLEQINDYSYNCIEEIVVEDDGDTIYVMVEYKDKLI